MGLVKLVSEGQEASLSLEISWVMENIYLA
jgi:hypothetical protein